MGIDERRAWTVALHSVPSSSRLPESSLPAKDVPGTWNPPKEQFPGQPKSVEEILLYLAAKTPDCCPFGMYEIKSTLLGRYTHRKDYLIRSLSCSARN